MTRIRRGAVAALLLLALPLTLAGPATAAPSAGAARTAPVPPLELPAPTGKHAVGTSTFQLKDRSRTDHWVPSSGARKLLVSMHYPAREGTGKPAARPYMSAEESRLLLTRTGMGQLIPAEHADKVAATRTHARDRAVPARGKHPLVVLSPGFSLPRTSLTLLAEELASRGYVVASVDHPYESEATAYPGQGVLPCTSCRTLEQAGDIRAYAAVSVGRAKDVSFLLDRLTDNRPPWRHARMIDDRRIGMAGHSIGGNSAAQTMATDPRVRAGVNMDGSFIQEVPATGIGNRPFMLLGEGHDQAKDEFWSWHSNWPRLDGWKRWLTVGGSHHLSFVDGPALADGIPGAPQNPALSGKRSAEITRGYVTAFFDQHLRGIARPVLDGPTPGNPEVVFHQR